MKKHLLTALAIISFGINLLAQTVVIPAGNPATTGSPSASVLRKPFSTFYGFERSAMIFTSAEIGSTGIITDIQFYMDAASTPGAAPVKVYMKEIANTAFSAATKVANEEATATLVYDQTVSTFTQNSFITLNLSSPFIYTGSGSLEIIVETNEGFNGNETSGAKVFRFNQTSDNKFQYWQDDDVAPTTSGVLSLYRPNILINFTPASPCIEPPVVGNIIANDTMLCTSENVLLRLDTFTYGSGQINQWQSSSDGLNWLNINGATGINYNASIISDTYFRFTSTCGATTVNSEAIKLYLNSAVYCYCQAVHSNTCSASIKNVTITGTSLNNSLTCTSGSTPVASFPASGNTTATLTKGVQYQFSITTSAANIISFWIDYNQNGIYDSTEWHQPTTASTANVATVYNFTVDLGATVGTTGMRVRTRAQNNTNNANSSCISFASGETHDYIINIVDAAPCTEPPTAGSIANNDTSLCSGTIFNLDVVGYVYAGGQTNQWQSSTDGNNWTNISNANGLSYSSTLISPVYIRFTTTCGATTVNTPAVFINQSALMDCYCTSSATSTNDDDIGRVVFNTIDNGSDVPQINNPASVNTYTDYTSISTTLIKGNTYPLSVSQINKTAFYDCEITAYIDFNINGVFDIPEEQFVLGATTDSNMTLTGNIDIPIGAGTGTTKMRIVLSETYDLTACGTYTWGETEDYAVVLEDPGPCSDPPVAGTTQTSKAQICAGTGINLFLNGNSYGTGQTYTWQSSSDSTQWTNINGAYQPTYSTNTVNVTTYYRCKLTCGNGTSYSVPVKVFVKPFNLCYCNAGLQSNVCDNNTGILGVEIVWEDFINYNQCTNGGAAYTSFPTTTVTDNLGLGQIYNIRVLANSTVNMAMWIDYNQNGIYETSEFTLIATNQTSGNPADAFFTIPQNAVLGETGMRIRIRPTAITSSDACTAFSSGETQDYVITIDNSVGLKDKTTKASLVIAPNPANQQINLSGRGVEGNIAEYAIYSINGAIVKSDKLNVSGGSISSTINISDLSAGVYQIMVKGTNTVLNQKLVIQR